MAFQLVVGLGNPGNDYQFTRHNIGFDVLQTLVDEKKVSFRRDSMGPVEVAKLAETVFLKPLTYMNLSGSAIHQWLHWLKLPESELLVVVDDAALPLGELRFRKGGSAGGHNGLKSIQESLGTSEYARLRCGVGPLPDRWAMDEFVLAKFSKEERPQREEMLQQAILAIQYCQQEGIEVAMNRFNGVQRLESEKEE